MVRIFHILSLCLTFTSGVKSFFDADAAFLNASEHGCIEGMKEALGRGAHMQTRNNFATTPLIFAANNGHLPAVRFLLDIDADIEAFSNNGRTPLIWACYWGHIDVVKYLISRGANIDATDFGKLNKSFILLQNYHLYSRVMRSLCSRRRIKCIYFKLNFRWHDYSHERCI
jgi:ankyrin repeat protein